MIEPMDRYRSLLATGKYRQDDAQLELMQALNDVFVELVHDNPQRGWLQRFRGNKTPVKGLYIWGGVGRGKTWLMDIFFESLPFEEKQRLHFHRFMARVHDELKQRKSDRNPLEDIARKWSEQCRVLCFDEFFVSDIADAMLLAGLLETLFEQGVTLVATSNIAPDELYRDGLQRARFLPAIDLIKKNTRVHFMPDGEDHRLRLLERSTIYHFPLDQAAAEGMENNFNRMCAEEEHVNTLKVNQRTLQALHRRDDVIWFDFNELCQKPRSTSDFIEIARAFTTVLLSDVTVMSDETADSARRFINLVDEFYDRNVKLLISAEAPIEDLYQGQRMAFEFERTRSRLIEMQSKDYLARPHLP